MYLDFETLSSNTGLVIQRAIVPGGWLVLVVSDVLHTNLPNREGSLEGGWDWRPGATFIPDPLHLWGIV